MERFVVKCDSGLTINCNLCSRYGRCFCEESCIQELKERLYKLEESAFVAEQKIMANPFLSKLYEKMKGD